MRTRAEWRDIMVGSEFDRLTVIGQQFRLYASRPEPSWAVVVECECGTVKIVLTKDLQRRLHKSCGCWRVQVAEKMGAANMQHGLEGTPLYIMWRNMKRRCSCETDNSYADYGGRGIRVCDDWKDFWPFKIWALSAGYITGLQIDRRQNEGNYEPGNCRFVTAKVNSRNKRNTIFVTAFSETKPLAEWADDNRCRVARYTLWKRIKDHWTPETAISSPPTPRPQRRMRTVS